MHSVEVGGGGTCKERTVLSPKFSITVPVQCAYPFYVYGMAAHTIDNSRQS